jgi:diguanylate cyclase (GGDEF)-like protein
MDGGYDPQALLRTLWQKHLRAARERGNRELGELIGKPSPEDPWTIRHRNLEAVVRASLSEFEHRAPHGEATLAFLRSPEPLNLLSSWTSEELERVVSRSITGVGPREKQQTQARGEGLIQQLRKFVVAELRVIAASLPQTAAEEPKVRALDQKFGILDGPQLLRQDLAAARGRLGVALVYLDVDHFKQLNTRFTETLVDKTVLPQLQRLIVEVCKGHGRAYAEGGDEVTVLLDNFSQSMAAAFAVALAEAIRSARFEVEAQPVTLTISAGVAASENLRDFPSLPERANLAKQYAKEHGRDCVSVWSPSGCSKSR